MWTEGEGLYLLISSFFFFQGKRQQEESGGYEERYNQRKPNSNKRMRWKVWINQIDSHVGFFFAQDGHLMKIALPDFYARLCSVCIGIYVQKHEGTWGEVCFSSHLMLSERFRDAFFLVVYASSGRTLFDEGGDLCSWIITKGKRTCLLVLFMIGLKQVSWLGLYS